MRKFLLLVLAPVLVAGCGGGQTATLSPTPPIATATPSPTAVAAPQGAWTSLQPISPGASYAYTQLQYAQCNGGNDCWADGFAQTGTSSFTQLLEHWDGHMWTTTSPSVPPASIPTALGELDCLPSGFCVIPNSAGKTSIYSVTAGVWTQMSVDDVTTAALTNSEAFSVACLSMTSCVGVGDVTDATSSHAQAMGLVWDGTMWKSRLLPLVGTAPVNSLVSVSCASETLCFGVGLTSTGPTDPGQQGVIAKWDGSTWTDALAPAGTRVESIVCVDPSFCLAVGSQGQASLALVWDGSKWANEQMPLSGNLFAVSCASRDFCMALQTPDTNKPLGQAPQAIRWHGKWFPVTGFPAAGAYYLGGLSCYDGGCFVAGMSRDTPSTSANDISGARATAAEYTIGASGGPAATSQPQSSATATPRVASTQLSLTGSVTATITSAAKCFPESGHNTIQINASDSSGADITITLTDQNPGLGGTATILSGGTFYTNGLEGTFSVTATSAMFTGAVLLAQSGPGRITVNGSVSC